MSTLIILLFSLITLAACSEISEPTTYPFPTPTLSDEATIPMPAQQPQKDTELNVFEDISSPGRTPLQGIQLERVFPNLDFQRLTNLVQPDDGRSHIFVTEQPGKIHVFPVDPGTANAEVFLDIRDRVSESNNEEGLLGLAFDPKYATNGQFYVYYSASSPRRSVISRFSVNENNPNLADPLSESIILEVSQPYGNHNGGQIVFGPDGYLYIGLGDGGSSGDPMGNAQNLSTLLGAILRIDVRGASKNKNYGIPLDNPFLDINGAREEIWAYGLRNPWRFSFDERTGLLWTGDVGQKKWEEIDVLQRGLNYGWNTMEGSHCFSPGTNCDTTNLTLPVAEYDRNDGCSITGGYVYIGVEMPWLLGTYIYGDFCSGKIWGLHHDGESVIKQSLLLDSNLSITSFAQGVDGSLYVLSRNDGIYRILPKE